MDIFNFNTIISVMFAINIMLGLGTVLADNYSMELELNATAPNFTYYQIDNESFQNATSSLELNPDLANSQSAFRVIYNLLFGFPVIIKKGLIALYFPATIYNFIHYGLVTLMSVIYILYLLRLLTLVIGR